MEFRDFGQNYQEPSVPTQLIKSFNSVTRVKPVYSMKRVTEVETHNAFEALSSDGDHPLRTMATAAKASFVGAKTVIGPGPERASTRLAFVKLSTNVDNSGRDAAVSRMVGVGVGPNVGTNTASTTRTTPFEHTTSACMTVY